KGHEKGARPPRGEEQGEPRQGGAGRKPKREDRPAGAPRPPRAEKPIDPDNPFAALMSLKLRS
ncbi:hypothetical protein, partial [Amaricoccus sp.]|uniref:hypothetical protein n=1 Tax=Amaricoccus sp. TaxID=1872485 RepID=UPI00262AF79C